MGKLWIVILLFPLIHQLVPVLKVQQITGFFESTNKRDTLSWWDGSLQKHVDHYLADSLSIRPFCYRLRNQLEYSLADKLNSQDLYAYQGIFFRMTSPVYSIDAGYVGKEKVDQDLSNLLAYRQQKDAKPMYFLIPSFKFHLYPENLPVYNRLETTENNYYQYTRALRKNGFNLLDADRWFRKLQSTKDTPALMGTGGVHWSLYAATLAMDSLVTQVEANEHQVYTHPNYVLDSSSVYDEDEDGYRLANLLARHADPKLRQVHFPEPVKSGRKIRAVIISDSYFHAVYWTGLFDQVFDSGSVFYYYLKTRKQRGVPDQAFEKSVLEEDLRQADLILVISEVNNLEHFAFGLPGYLSHH